MLGTDTQSDIAGVLFTFLIAIGASRGLIPMSVVPGNLADE